MHHWPRPSMAAPSSTGSWVPGSATVNPVVSAMIWRTSGLREAPPAGGGATEGATQKGDPDPGGCRGRRDTARDDGRSQERVTRRFSP